MLRSVAVVAFAAALLLAPGAIARSGVAAGTPTHLRAFLLRADEPTATVYPRTPSFAWDPAPDKGGHYDFELATSRTFEDSSILFKDTNVPIPAETISRQLPWMTGDPYALWAHVRWVSSNGLSATRWSEPFGFNLSWEDVPTQETAPIGLIRWTPVEGATAYQVIYTDLKPAHTFETTTNVADEREFFTFRSQNGYSATIHWRVRAIRTVTSADQATNGLPADSYGPWSPVFTTVNTPQAAAAKLTPGDTVSDAWATGGKADAFSLMPGFSWTGTAEVQSDGIDPGSPLYRVYVFTDKNCVNKVFTGSIVGSPAFAPRVTGGPIALPTGTVEIGKITSGADSITAGPEGGATDATGDPVTPNEQAAGSTASSTASSSSATAAAATPAQVDLGDSGWPTGRYYWTVVPVTVAKAPGASTSSSSSSSSSSAPADTPVQYEDAALPQDQCEAGGVQSFGKVSQPVVTSAGSPYISGVSPSGRLVEAADSNAKIYASPVVAWQPATGATSYQVELSRSAYPWRIAKRIATPATSVTLPLSKDNAGVWYYRVRGLDASLPAGARTMTWSDPVRIRITGNQFAVVK